MIRGRKRAVALASGAALLAALIVVAIIGNAGRVSAELSGQTTVTASSFTSGHLPRTALAGTGGGSWQPVGPGDGSWWQVAWKVPVQLGSLSVDQPQQGGAATRVMVSFGDGTRMIAGMNRGTTRIEFSARSVGSVRVTVLNRSSGVEPIRFSNVSTADDKVVREVNASAGPVKSIAAEGLISVDGGTSAALTDGSGRDPGQDWVAIAPGPVEFTIRWDRPREVSAIELVGSSVNQGTVRQGTVTFAAGDSIRFGGVLPDPSRPTQLAFMPRVVTSMKLQLVPTDAQPVRLAELRIIPTGQALSTPPSPSGTRLVEPLVPQSSCDAAPAPAAQIVLRCPTAGSSVVGTAVVVVQGPVGLSLAADLWGNGSASIALQARPYGPAGSGLVAFDIDARTLPGGPMTLSVESPAGSVAPLRIPLFNASKRTVSAPAPSASLLGGRLVYSEEFGGPLTVSRDGSLGAFTAAKPEITGVSDFGDAPFADPAGGTPSLAVVDSLLRIDLLPRAGGGLAGGLLASSRSGGSGFAAEYGYFEARMYAPMAAGTWPAFWVLPSSNLAQGLPDVAEFDAVELYGHDPQSSCSATHHFQPNVTPGGQTFCGKRAETVRDAARWHTYGVRVNPTSVEFTVDGKVVAIGDQVPGGAEPMFYLLDLAAGGGWPTDLSGTGGRQQLYVDWVRVYE